MIVKTYRSVLADYRIHPEAKSLGPDGKRCGKQTRGLLSRRPVKTAAVHYIGKESNKIEEALSGLIADLDDALTEYHNPDQNPFQRLVIPILRQQPVAQTADGAAVSERTVERARPGQPVGTIARAKLTAYAIRCARAQHRAAGTRPPTDPEALLATYLDQLHGERQHPAGDEAPVCQECRRLITRRGQRGPAPKWCSDKCRKQSARREE